MKIDNAQISMQSRHAATVHQETRESLRAWIGSERPDFEGRGNRIPAERAPRPVVQLSEAALAAQSAETSEATAIEAAADAADNDPMLLLIRQMVEMLTGKSVRVFAAADRGDDAAASTAAPTEPRRAAAADFEPPAGFGIEYDFHSVYEESELTTFSAQGVVRTADGREISFQIDLSMARHYREQIDISLRAGDAARQRKDPLVLNFNGNAAQLTDQRFRFDLDADGRTEELAMLASGSGYLTLDRNGNGAIDNGKELFGPATGTGFAELAAYDEDGNGWIDENDSVYSRLRVWTPAASGNGSLATLKERQVGALFLGQLATPFELRGAQNSDLGAVRASGLYLSENGQAGTLQEIDLVV